MVTEAAVTRSIRAYLATVEGWFGFKVHGAGMSSNGIPDLIGCYRGRFVGLEIKAGRRPATPLQLHRMCQIRESGGVAEVVRSVEDVDAVLSRCGGKEIEPCE